jgi:hypothetical protein
MALSKSITRLPETIDGPATKAASVIGAALDLLSEYDQSRVRSATDRDRVPGVGPGYSQLMARDEVGTLARLKTCRVIIDELIASHRGRIFNTAGDSVVADFASVVDAVQCAIAVQAAVATENAGDTVDEPMQFRIGVQVAVILRAPRPCASPRRGARGLRAGSRLVFLPETAPENRHRSVRSPPPSGAAPRRPQSCDERAPRAPKIRIGLTDLIRNR